MDADKLSPQYPECHEPGIVRSNAIIVHNAPNRMPRRRCNYTAQKSKYIQSLREDFGIDNEVRSVNPFDSDGGEHVWMRLHKVQTSTKPLYAARFCIDVMKCVISSRILQQPSDWFVRKSACFLRRWDFTIDQKHGHAQRVLGRQALPFAISASRYMADSLSNSVPYKFVFWR
jgi:hypothetical protein